MSDSQRSFRHPMRFLPYVAALASAGFCLYLEFRDCADQIAQPFQYPYASRLSFMADPVLLHDPLPRYFNVKGSDPRNRVSGSLMSVKDSTAVTPDMSKPYDVCYASGQRQICLSRQSTHIELVDRVTGFFGNNAQQERWILPSGRTITKCSSYVFGYPVKTRPITDKVDDGTTFISTDVAMVTVFDQAARDVSAQREAARIEDEEQFVGQMKEIRQSEFGRLPVDPDSGSPIRLMQIKSDQIVLHNGVLVATDGESSLHIDQGRRVIELSQKFLSHMPEHETLSVTVAVGPGQTIKVHEQTHYPYGRNDEFTHIMTCRVGRCKVDSFGEASNARTGGNLRSTIFDSPLMTVAQMKAMGHTVSLNAKALEKTSPWADTHVIRVPLPNGRKHDASRANESVR